MDYKGIAKLIRQFVEEREPQSMYYLHPTIDEQIEQEPYCMLLNFADWLDEHEK